MRRLLVHVLFALLVSCLSLPAGVKASVIFSTPKQGIVNHKGVDLKNGPDLNEKTLCRITDKDTSVKVLGRQGDWLKVKMGPCEGWVEATYITMESDVPISDRQKEPVAVEKEAPVVPKPAPKPAEDLILFPTPQKRIIVHKKVDVKNGPDLNEKTLCRIYVPDEYVNKMSVTVLGRQGGWYKVKFGTCLGWLQETHLALEGVTPLAEEKMAAAAKAEEAAVAAQKEQARQEALRKQKEEEARLEALKKQKEEEARLEALKKQKEEEARLEALKKQKEEEARLEALKKQKEEEARLEALKKQKEEEARLEALKKQKEEEARLEAIRKQEEAEKQAEAEKLVLFPTPKQGIVTQKKFDLKKGPDSNEKTLCRIYVPDDYVNVMSVKVLGRQDDWYKVKFGSCLGWLQENYITLEALTPPAEKKMVAAAEPAEEAAEPEAEPEKVVEAPAKIEEETLKPETPETPPEKRFAESSVLFSIPEEGTEVDRKVDLRKGPDLKEKTVCRIYIPSSFIKDTWVRVLDRDGDWYKVKMGSCEGWVQGTYLALTHEAPAAETTLALRKEQEKQAELEKEKAEQERLEAIQKAKEEAERQAALKRQKEEEERQIALEKQREEQERTEAIRKQQEEEKKAAEAKALVLFSTPQKGMTNNIKVDFKKAPDVEEETLCRIPEKGTAVKVLGRKGGWYKAIVEDCEGWIQSAYITLEEVAPSAMVAVAAPEKEAVEPEKEVKEPIEEEVIEPKEEAKEPAADEEAEKPKAPGVFVKEIVFTGNTVIDTETLAAVAEPYKNRELTLNEMKELAGLVTVTYQDQGYILAKAYLPEQKVQDGILTITILEGNLAKFEVAGNKYYQDRVLKRYFKPQIKHRVIKESLLEKGLLLANEVDSAEAALVLKRGEQPGDVDAVLNTKDRIAAHLKFDYNNFGSVEVSDSRYAGTFTITDPIWGSTFSLRGVTGETYDNSSLWIANWSAPIGGYGTRFGVSYLKSDYAVGGDLAYIGLTGDTEIYGGKLTHPIIKNRSTTLNLNLGYDHKYSENVIEGVGLLNIDELDVYYVGFDINHLDRFLGKSIATFTYSYGEVDVGDPVPLRNNYDDTFSKFNLHYIRIQKVYGYINLMARVAAQYTDQRVLAIEQSVIGGYGTARGHEAASFLGDSGFTLSAELMLPPPFIAERTYFGQRLGQMVQFSAFVDHSEVYTNEPDENMEETKWEYMTGVGFGLRLYYKNMLSFKYDIAFPTEKEAYDDSVYHYFQFSWNAF